MVIVAGLLAQFWNLFFVFLHGFWRRFVVCTRARFAWVLMGVVAFKSTILLRAMEYSSLDDESLVEAFCSNGTQDAK